MRLSSPLFCPQFFILFTVPLAFSAALFTPAKNVSLLTYANANELCAREGAKHVKYCNLHNPINLCICYVPVEFVYDGVLLCSNLLRLDSLEYLVLTLSVAFPVPRGFLSDPDSILAEDLELFTGFAQSSVLFLRKGCSSDRLSYIFQFAILRHVVNPPYNVTDLRLIYPQIFKIKTFFMRQEGLIIKRVKQSKFLMPLIGYASAKKKSPTSIGFCAHRNAIQCYEGELALLFLVGFYASAECCCAICCVFVGDHRPFVGLAAGGGAQCEQSKKMFHLFGQPMKRTTK